MDEKNQAIKGKKRDSAARGRWCRRKGHQFERDVANYLKPWFPNARRHYESQDIEANGVDLVDTGEFRFQCKKLKTYASVNTIDEIQCERALGDVPVLVTQADNKPAMVVMHFEDFLALVDRSRPKGGGITKEK